MRKFIFVMLCLLLPLSVKVTHAEVPGFERTVYLNAKGQRPNDFINSLFSQIGVPVKIDTEINGTVNGVFEGVASDIFAEFSRTYNVHVYFNRSIAYVYRAADITDVLLPMNNAKAHALTKVIGELKLTDRRNTIYFVKGAGLEVVGSKRFVEKVEDLANKLKVSVKPRVSKQLKSEVKGNEEEDPQLIVREFKLKYASVIDKSQTISGHEVTIPGVATMLRQFIDKNQLPTSIVVSDKKGELVENAISLPKVNSTHKNFQARIMAHPQTNSVWIEDSIDRMSIYQDMIRAMDQEPRMVEIEATIIDINNSRQQELGINWRALKGNDEFLLGNGTSQDLLLNPGENITPTGEGGILSLVMGNRTQFIARMKALENLGAAKFVSKPHVITNSNVEAILGATTEFFVRLEGNEAVSLEEKSFGTVLRVTPRVFEDGDIEAINLMISIEDGATSGGSVDNIPEIERSVVGTQTMIQQGQSLLIGGLIRESTQNRKSKVPLLGDIPGIGRLFQSNGRSVTKTERLFLITPRIVGQQIQNSDGPVLQGSMAEIVASSDQRSDRLDDEVRLKAERQRKEVEGDSPFKGAIDTFKKSGAADPVPTTPVAKTQLSDLLVVPVLNSKSTNSRVQSVSHSNPSVSVWRVRNASEEKARWRAIH